MTLFVSRGAQPGNDLRTTALKKILSLGEGMLIFVFIIGVLLISKFRGVKIMNLVFLGVQRKLEVILEKLYF